PRLRQVRRREEAGDQGAAGDQPLHQGADHHQGEAGPQGGEGAPGEGCERLARLRARCAGGAGPSRGATHPTTAVGGPWSAGKSPAGRARLRSVTRTAVLVVLAWRHGQAQSDLYEGGGRGGDAARRWAEGSEGFGPHRGLWDDR